jgi:hypothetical protein
MGTTNDLLASLIDWALSLGASGRHVLPLLGLALGALLLGGGHFWWHQRLRRHGRDLAESARRRIPRSEEGRRVVLVGRLRVAGSESVPSFVDGARVAVSSLFRAEGRALAVLDTRRATGLSLETEDGLVPIHGTVHVERTVAPRPLAGSDSRCGLDVAAGELVMVEGLLGRVQREGLREQGALLGLSSESDDFGHVPIRMTALRLELPRALPRAILAGALLGAVVLTPWPIGLPSRLVVQPDPMTHPQLAEAGWRATVLVRLLAPTRTATLERLRSPAGDWTNEDVRWALASARELGDCAGERRILVAVGRPIEVATCVERPPTAIEAWLAYRYPPWHCALVTEHELVELRRRARQEDPLGYLHYQILGLLGRVWLP